MPAISLASRHGVGKSISEHITFLEKTTPDFRDTYGNRIAMRVSDRIVDNYRNRVYEIRGDRIYDTYGNWKYEIRGNRIYDTYGNWKYGLCCASHQRIFQFDHSVTVAARIKMKITTQSYDCGSDQNGDFTNAARMTIADSPRLAGGSIRNTGGSCGVGQAGSVRFREPIRTFCGTRGTFRCTSGSFPPRYLRWK